MTHRAQGDIFLESEGSRWFERNKERLLRFNPDADLHIRLLEMYRISARNVLEIGAANGARLEAMRRRGSSRCVALEPSSAAIEDGRSRYPGVLFHQGLAHDVPIGDKFDLVIVHFVLHWIDRALLLRSVSEIDRLLEDGGYLLLGDFLPSNFTRVRYHHLPGEEIYTYKQDYSRLFTASGLYHRLALLGADHADLKPRSDCGEQDRVGVWLLRKDLRGQYMTVSLG